MKTILAAVAFAAMTAAVAGFAFRQNPEAVPPPIVKTTQTITLAQIPFDTPSWVPDEATKRKALLEEASKIDELQQKWLRLRGDRILEGEPPMPADPLPSAEEIAGRIKPYTGRVTADAPAHTAAEAVISLKAFSALDAEANKPPKGYGRQRLAHRNDGKPEDVCTRHGMHKTYYGDKWRCRK